MRAHMLMNRPTYNNIVGKPLITKRWSLAKYDSYYEYIQWWINLVKHSGPVASSFTLVLTIKVTIINGFMVRLRKILRSQFIQSDE